MTIIGTINAFIERRSNCIPSETKKITAKKSLRGFSKEIILTIKRAYKEVYRKGLSIDEALLAIEKQSEPSPQLQVFTDSIKNSSRGIIR